jgi:VIT1/CCC1 family predicted Fe2+/Mn2+ transporter
MTELSDDHVADLERYHQPGAIRQRMNGEGPREQLRDAILGAIDGGITTFAVVSGAIGGGFSGLVVVVLGFASLLADGFSMAVSNFLSTKSEHERLDAARREERLHIDTVPDGQRQEVREAFRRKGFEGETLDRIVDVITSDPSMWIDTVVRDVHQLPLHGSSPLRAALATFLAFLMMGAVPLAPFLVPALTMEAAFIASATLTGIAFFTVGVIKGRILGHSLVRSGLQILLTGGSAALLAYGVGTGLRQLVGGGV